MNLLASIKGFETLKLIPTQIQVLLNIHLMSNMIRRPEIVAKVVLQVAVN